jgi:hypothetical protein
MTTLIMQAAPFVEAAAPTLRSFYLRFLSALDTFAENRIRNAVPESEQRRATREIARYRRMMKSDRKSSANTAQAAR